MSHITPTIGRKVWFRPLGIGYTDAGPVHSLDADQPMDATVIHVHQDGTVNLLVVDHMGCIHPMRGIALRQADDEAPSQPYCEWMPYQVSQAAKHEPAEVALTSTAPDTQPPAGDVQPDAAPVVAGGDVPDVAGPAEANAGSQDETTADAPSEQAAGSEVAA